MKTIKGPEIFLAQFLGDEQPFNDKLTEQLVGPPYSAVAERYAKTDLVIDTLSDKIVKGGSGRWGTVPMTAHPQISKEDAATMVKYVLSITK